MQTLTINQTQNINLPGKPSILEKFDALRVGESIIVKNGHSLEILLCQLLGDRGHTFSWEYLEKGPETWRIRFTKLASGKNSSKIGTLAVEDYRKAELFHRFGIDYCCNGDKSLQQAFKEAGLSEKIWNEWYIEALQYKDKEIHAFKNWEVTFLVDYIINTHHSYIRNNSELIRRLAYKVTARHGFAYPELKELDSKLNRFLIDLNNHINNEEQEVFPTIKKIAHRRKSSRQIADFEMEKTHRFEYSMVEEHRIFGEELKKIRRLTHNFKLPTDACATYTHYFAKLMEFENDLVQHIHLENNILLPKLT